MRNLASSPTPTGSEGPRDFQSLPPLSAFFTRGGVPGVRYAYIELSRLLDFQRRGWEQLNPPVVFSIQGIAVACLGWGRPIRGISSYSRRPILYIDQSLQKKLKESTNGTIPEQSEQAVLPNEDQQPRPAREVRNRDAGVRSGQPPLR